MKTLPTAQRTESTITREPADLILSNGNILTLDKNFGTADAIAISGDRILAVGSNTQVALHAATWTRFIDLDGRTVVPGLIDGHAHMDREGLKSVFPQLGAVRSIQDIQDRIAELAREKQPGEWIVTMPIGDPPFYFNVPDILVEKRWPTRQELDAAAPNNPVFIRPIWGFWRHSPPLVACANTLALKLAGITRDTRSPIPELTIEKDQNGDPTGVFTEIGMQPTAEQLWFRKATRFTHADRVRTLPNAAQAYHAFGTTSVYEEHGVATELLRAYKEAYRNGFLTMRASLAFSPNWKTAGHAPLGPFLEAWAGWLGEPSLGDDWLKVTGMYVNITHTPADDLRAGTTPDTGWAGFNYDTGMPRERLKEVLMHCAENDIRAVTNSYAAPGIIDIFDEVDRIIPLKGRRWVLGHISSLTPRDIEKIVRMELAVSTHTNNFIYKQGRVLKNQLPPDRHREITPLRDLLDAGVKVSLATDNVPVSLFWPIWQVVARQDVGQQPVAPEQAITRAEALRCATEYAAYLTFDEDKKGKLEPGKLADLAVLDADPLGVEETKLRDIKAIMTMVGGKIVYETTEWKN